MKLFRENVQNNLVIKNHNATADENTLQASSDSVDS